MVGICSETGERVGKGVCGWGRIQRSNERYVQTPAVFQQFCLFYLRILFMQFGRGLARAAGVQMLGFERMLGDPCFRPLHRADGSRDGEYQQEDCCRDPFHNSEVAPYNRYRLPNWCYAGKILKVTYVEPRS